MRPKHAATALAIVFTLTTMNSFGEKAKTMQKQEWGKTADGEQVYLFTLSNKKGMEAAVTTYGGAVVSLKVADRKGEARGRGARL